MDFPGGSVVKNPPAKARDAGSIPGSRIFPREENGHPPLQYSGLENPVDIDVQRAMVHGLAKESDTS